MFADPHGVHVVGARLAHPMCSINSLIAVETWLHFLPSLSAPAYHNNRVVMFVHMVTPRVCLVTPLSAIS